MKPAFLLSTERSGTTFFARAMEGIEGVRSVPEYQVKIMLDGKREDIRRLATSSSKAAYWLPYIDQWDEETGLVQRIEQTVAASLGADSENTRYWFDHTPANARDFELLRDLFPQARWIALMRDPRATFSSLRKVPWGIDDVYDFCTVWLHLCAVMQSALAAGLISEVVYFERVLAEPDFVMSGVAKSLGSAWRGMPDTAGFQVTGTTEAQHRNVGSEPQLQVLDTWREALREPQLLVLERILSVPMEMHGYECITETRQRHGTAFVRRQRTGLKRRVSRWFRS